MKFYLIGNNLTSLFLAYILSKKKIYSEICSTKSNKLPLKTRTIGISSYNINYLENYFNNISKKTNPINEIQILTEYKNNYEKILFNKNSESLFNMVKYDQLLYFVKSKIKKNKFITIKKNKNVRDIKKLIYSNKLIINCEGSNFITKKFQKKGIFKNYNNIAYTTLITHKKIFNNKATQVFTAYGPLAFLPLSQQLTSIVFSFDLKSHRKISNNEILNLIKKYNTSYKILKNENLELFNLNLKLAKKYFYKNILFFGDSIHSIHPLAGQGFNMTIRDIIKFEKIIENRLELGLEINKDIFKEFEDNAKSYNSVFSLGVDFIYELFKFDRRFISKNISKKIFTFINNSSKIKDLSIRIANQGDF